MRGMKAARVKIPVVNQSFHQKWHCFQKTSKAEKKSMKATMSDKKCLTADIESKQTLQIRIRN